jgi:hypothetical protein
MGVLGEYHIGFLVFTTKLCNHTQAANRQKNRQTNAARASKRHNNIDAQTDGGHNVPTTMSSLEFACAKEKGLSGAVCCFSVGWDDARRKWANNRYCMSKQRLSLLSHLASSSK